MIRILERKQRLTGQESLYRCELIDLAPSGGILRHVLEKAVPVDILRLEAGTITYGFYWIDRMYNLYWWLNPGNRTIAYYYNIADSTRLNRREFSWRDLAIDILILPEGRPKVLDADELPEDIDEGLLRRIRSAVKEVVDGHSAIVNEARAWLAKAGIRLGGVV
jgi:predicted RNA-binding protein associated with RNAse of E/G family